MNSLMTFFDTERVRGGPSPENVRRAEEIRRKFRFCAAAPFPPEARAPEASEPEAKAPEARAPEARAPEARAPEPVEQSWSCRKCKHRFGLRRTRDLHEARCRS